MIVRVSRDEYGSQRGASVSTGMHGSTNRDYRTGCFVSVHEDSSCGMIRAREGSWECRG